MSRKSGYRFSEKDMRKRKRSGAHPDPFDRDVLQRVTKAGASGTRGGHSTRITQRSPRVIAMIWSVLRPFPAWPRRRANRLGRVFLPTMTRTDSAVVASLEIDDAPWTDPQKLADLLWDRDLALAGDGSRHDSSANATF